MEEQKQQEHHSYRDLEIQDLCLECIAQKEVWVSPKMCTQMHLLMGHACYNAYIGDSNIQKCVALGELHT